MTPNASTLRPAAPAYRCAECGAENIQAWVDGARRICFPCARRIEADEENA